MSSYSSFFLTQLQRVLRNHTYAILLFNVYGHRPSKLLPATYAATAATADGTAADATVARMRHQLVCSIKLWYHTSK